MLECITKYCGSVPEYLVLSELQIEPVRYRDLVLPGLPGSVSCSSTTQLVSRAGGGIREGLLYNTLKKVLRVWVLG